MKIEKNSSWPQTDSSKLFQYTAKATIGSYLSVKNIGIGYYLFALWQLHSNILLETDKEQRVLCNLNIYLSATLFEKITLFITLPLACDRCIKLVILASCFDILLRPLLVHTFRLRILRSATASLLCDSLSQPYLTYLKLTKNKGFFVGQW